MCGCLLVKLTNKGISQVITSQKMELNINIIMVKGFVACHKLKCGCLLVEVASKSPFHMIRSQKLVSDTNIPYNWAPQHVNVLHKNTDSKKIQKLKHYYNSVEKYS